MSLSDDTYFNVTVEIKNIDFKSKEIEKLSFIRCPIKKISSFGMCTLELSNVYVAALAELIDNKVLPDLKITIVTVDLADREPTDNRSFTPRKKLIEKEFKIISIDNASVNADEDLKYITIVFVNNILFYLGNVQLYNKVLKSMTAKNALLAFEGFLEENFEGVFNFRKVNDKINCNNHIYEQILIKTGNDLQIPNLLLYNYKLLNSFGFYFFDDFSLVPSNSNDVEAILINLTSVKKFKRINVFDSHLHRSNIKNITPLHNPLNPLMFSKDLHPVVKDLQTSQKHVKKTGQVNMPGKVVKSTSETMMLDSERPYNSNVTKNKATPIDLHGRIKIYAPDSMINAEERFETMANQLTNEMLNVIEINSPRTLPTEVQFGYVYNFDAHLDTLTAGSVYNYTPISIVNTFSKESSKKTELVHTVRAQFLKFTNE